MKVSALSLKRAVKRLLTVSPVTEPAAMSSATAVSVEEPEATGASLTAVTLMTKVCEALVSTPLLSTPPLSWICTVTVALPLALAAGV